MKRTPKHTPGPWTYELIEVDGRICADVRGPKPWPEKSSIWYYTEADARLIAAAPELLEALKLHVEPFYSVDDENNAYEKAIAAIAKATGEWPRPPSSPLRR